MSIKTALYVSFALVASCTSAFSQETVPLNNCDKYSGSPLDPRMKGAGVASDKIDPKLAIPACEEAVRNYPSNTQFMFQLGRSYFAAKDDAQALAWFRKSADQGYALAQVSLGVIYAEGLGVPKDDAQAVAWFRKAADQGVELAKTQLEKINNRR